MIVCAVNSSSKYRVSVSDMTWGLNGGISCGKKDNNSIVNVPSSSLISSPATYLFLYDVLPVD